MILGRMFIPDCGFDLASLFTNEIWDDVCFHKWDDFCIFPKQPVVVPVVLEFYSNLKFPKHNQVSISMLI